jgi:hypothetical protein
MLPFWMALFATFAVIALPSQPVHAIPIFAHQYGVTCQKCHSIIPHLNEFGARFMASGDRIPGLRPGPALPISTKFNLVASSENQGDGPDGAGLPKAIVDEVELFVAGAIGSRASYFVEQYVVDGGNHGLLRDMWVNDRLNPWQARIPVYIQAGSYTLPLPVDPETFRESAQHYTIFDQAIGNNPFNFFTPKVGATVTVGDTLRGASVRLFAGPGYDRVSGLPKTGIDLMENVSYVAGPITPTFYHYEGERPDTGMLSDRFSRSGWGLVFNQGKWTSESVLQTGWDSSANGVGTSSSGGFTQLRYAISQRLFTLARYEGTNDPINGFTRDTVILMGYRPAHNSRFTIEDVIAHTPQTTHTMNAQLTVGY